MMEYRRPEEAGAGDGEADSEPHYLRQLQDIAKSEVYTLNIDCAALQAFAATRPLYAQLVRYPAEVRARCMCWGGTMAGGGAQSEMARCTCHPGAHALCRLRDCGVRCR